MSPELLTFTQAAPVVGVFDSGVGGLSVLRSLLDELPGERFVYLADEAYLPYGDKPQHVIAQRVHAVATSMHRLACKAFVIACNTATAAAATQVRTQFAQWPIVGIEPAVKPASLKTRSGVVGILATSNTVASERFRLLVERFDPLATVLARPCPGLVELIETSPLPRTEILAHLKPVVDEFKAAGVDMVVLGCTHYPFVTDLIAELAGPDVEIIETGRAVARQLTVRLDEAHALSPMAQPRTVPLSERLRCVTTGEASSFRAKMLALMQGDGQYDWAAVPVEHVDLA
ncbi:MAG: glutamate racemase [Limnobacter sp.]|uniref:glutamate racemase n=1 Tax=Limnobacter sp. TaxID=2003368 RepID=UPI003918B93C